MPLSKSRFVAGCQCLKRLYLQVHARELAAQPDEADEAIIEQGREVGLLARKMFPGGVAVDARSRKDAIRATRELIENSEVPAIFEGAFEHRNVFARVDILHRPDFTDVVKHADTWVIQRRSGASLPPESFDRAGVFGHLRGEKLEGERTLESCVLSLVHNTHPPATDLLDDAVVRDGLANH